MTVAAIVERDGRFLMVEETTDEGLRINQPAGHLEPGESIVQAVVRETLEETAHDFTPHCLVGVYRWQNPGNGMTYLRFAFAGEIDSRRREVALDHDIVRTLWLTDEEIHADHTRLRSPLVARCIEDFRAGRHYSLDLLAEIA